MFLILTLLLAPTGALIVIMHFYRSTASHFLAFSTCSLKTLGKKLSDELSGSLLASKLSDRRPLEIFLGEALKKCKNGNFLLLLLLLENFVKKNFTRIGPCERARTQLSEYV